MSFYHRTIPQFEKTLTQVDKWIDKALAHAQAKNFDANTLLTARLAPDQYPLLKQLQVVCDNAKLTSSRLTGKEAPSYADNEKSWDELRTRIKGVLAYLRSFKPGDFEGAEARSVTLPWAPGKVLTGAEYLAEFALPNYYFHMTTAYSILRHNGVEVGKSDFLGSLPFKNA